MKNVTDILWHLLYILRGYGNASCCDEQTADHFSARYIRKEEPVPKRNRAVLLTAGSIGPREKAESTAEMLLRQMSCDSLGTVYVNRTDKVPVRDREDIIQEIKDLAGRLRTAE